MGSVSQDMIMNELKWTSVGHLKSNESRRHKADLSYLKDYGNCSTYQMPTCFENDDFKKDDTFPMRISNIYDPSKFWIVQKYRELEAFQVHLFRFYYKHKAKYQVPREKIEVGLYCSAFTDGGYYRGVIVSCHPSSSHEIERVKIFFFDYGLMQMITVEHIYYLGEEQSRVPKFAMRASLAGIVPFKIPTWTIAHVETFLKLVQNKELMASVHSVDKKQQLLVIDMATDDNNVSIANILVQDKVAQKYYTEESENESVLKVQNLHAFPTHESLEKGEYPFQLESSQKISRFVSLYKLYRQYF